MKCPPFLTVGLYIDSPDSDILKFVRALREWKMDFISIRRPDLATLKPQDCDVLLLHGGWYGIDRIPGQNQDEIESTPEHEVMAAAVRRFADTGGGVVGVCCGAFNIVWMKLIEADISRMFGVGPHHLEIVNEEHPIVRAVRQPASGHKYRKWKPIPCIRVSGPILFPKHPEHKLMSYDWEGRLGAVLAAPYGKGRAVAISPHPEMTAGERGAEVLNEPLMPVSSLLRASLEWAAGGKKRTRHERQAV